MLETKREKLEENMYDRGDNSNVSDLDNLDINNSENKLNSKEEYEGVENDEL